MAPRAARFCCCRMGKSCCRCVALHCSLGVEIRGCDCGGVDSLDYRRINRYSYCMGVGGNAQPSGKGNRLALFNRCMIRHLAKGQESRIAILHSLSCPFTHSLRVTLLIYLTAMPVACL